MTNEEALIEAKQHLQNVKCEKEFFGTTLIKDTIKWLKKVIEALEKVEQLEKENKELRSALRIFCFDTSCGKCPFKDDSWNCKLFKFLTDEEGVNE